MDAHQPAAATRGLRAAGLRLAGAPVPLVGRARIYTCGITPYDVTHLGHAATFVWADTLASVLHAAGVEVVACRNVTDIDDVLTAAAGARGRELGAFALYQEYLFDKDMAALQVTRPAHEPRARHHVRDVQQLAAALLGSGHGYLREGHVYFRGAGVPAAAGLAEPEALALAAEYGDDPGDPLRENPFDVPVWRASTGAEPAWPSPWGPGRPGWHAECAAMALSVFGPAVDVLAGGADLRFPHHAYQAAIAQAVTSVTPFARGTLHIGTVRRDGAKMAKSAGNLTLVTDLLRDQSPAAVRLLLLDRPWQRDWDYRPEALDAAAARLEQLYSAAGRPGGGDAGPDAVVEALLDDLDVPRAVEVALAGGAAARLLLRLLALA
jgi:cysteinyl-tRNA synthetase